MSIVLMTSAWKATLPAGRKMVLLALCDNANDQGECYPSIAMLAEKCSMGERTVQQHLSQMETAGIVEREMRAGRSTLYRLNPRNFRAADCAAPPLEAHTGPAIVAREPAQDPHRGGAKAAPITVIEPRFETALKPHAAPASLPEWLDAAAWHAWVDYRKSIKAPLTEQAARLCIAKLERLRSAGNDPVEVINNSIMSGRWTGLFAYRRTAASAGAASSHGKFNFSDVDRAADRAAMQASLQRYRIAVEGDDPIEF